MGWRNRELATLGALKALTAELEQELTRPERHEGRPNNARVASLFASVVVEGHSGLIEAYDNSDLVVSYEARPQPHAYLQSETTRDAICRVARKHVEPGSEFVFHNPDDRANCPCAMCRSFDA